MNMSEVEMRHIAEMVAALDKAGRKRTVNSAGELNRQQICAALGVSESTIRRLEQAGQGKPEESRRAVPSEEPVGEPA